MTGRSGCDIDVDMLDRTEFGQSVDVLGEILDSVRVESADAQALDLQQSRKCVNVEFGRVVILLVRLGRIRCELGGEPLELVEGDVLAVLRGTESMTLEPYAVPPVSGVDAPARVSAVGSGDVAVYERVALLRCTCRFADPDKNPLLGALPRVVHVSQRQWLDSQWLRPTVDWLEREVAAKSPVASVVVSRLVELLWMQLVRTHVATTPIASHGWLRALSDAQIGGALCLIHEQPATTFTVAGLAQAVGMSRSAFASLFTRLVGEPPLHYISRWRMLKAAQLLKEDKQTLAEVANAVGYDSEAAFSKAFKRWSGKAPGSYRRDRRSEPHSAAHLLAG